MKETLLEILARLECDIKELQSKPAIKQIDLSDDIDLIKKELLSKPVIKQVDYSKDIELIKKELLSIKSTISNKNKIDIKDKINEIVTQDFITNLYRNQNG